MKKICIKFIYTILFTFLFMHVSPMVVLAEDKNDEVVEVDETQQNTETATDSLGINAQTAILIDASSGTVLYEKNSSQQMFPASTTKIMTAILAIENGNLNDMLTTSNNAVDNIDRNSSHIFLDYGEQFTLEQGLYALMLQSSNDVAYVIAEHIGGTYENFILMMNEKAKEIGAVNTNFTNPHGLPDENHYTTAHDLALILKYAIKNDTFCKFATTKTYEMQPTNKQKNVRYFSNSNEHIKNGDQFYEPAVLGKTGFTNLAGYTFAEYAEIDDLKLIVVTMKSESADHRFVDSKKILNYGFENYKEVLIEASKIKPEQILFKKGWKKDELITFSMDDNFYMLTDRAQDTSNIELVVDITNKQDKALVNGHVIIYNNNIKVGMVEMNKESELFDTSFSATTLPIILDAFDLFSVLFMMFFVGLFILVVIMAKTKKRLR